jgi:hypothetical protein
MPYSEYLAISEVKTSSATSSMESRVVMVEVDEDSGVLLVVIRRIYFEVKSGKMGDEKRMGEWKIRQQLRKQQKHREDWKEGRAD